MNYLFGTIGTLRYPALKIGFSNRINISVISAELRETTLTILDSASETVLTLSQTSPGFYVSAVQVF